MRMTTIHHYIRRKITGLATDRKFSEIFRGSIWALGARISATVAGVLASIVVARVYGADMLGIVAMLQSFFVFATIFTVLGTNTSILRLIPEYITKYSPTAAFRVYRKTQYFVVAVSLLAGGLLLLSSGFIAGTIFSKPHLQPYLALAAVFVVFRSLILFNREAIRGLRIIRVYALMELLPQLTKLLILIAITLLYFHPDNPVYALLASYALTGLAGVWYINRTFRKRVAPEDARQHLPMKEILRISLPMLATRVMTFIIGETGVILLGVFRPEADVGYYSVAVRLATMTSFILMSLNSMAGPKFSELYHSGNMDELFYVAKKSAKLVFWSTTPILLGFVVLGIPILGLAFGREFIVAYPALVLLVIGQFVHSISGATGTFMNMTDHQNVLRNIMFVAAGGNLGLNLLLIPVWGIIGAAVAGMLSLAGWNIATLIYIKKKFGKSTGYFPGIG